MSLARDRLPEPVAFFEAEGLKLTGKGKWRSVECKFHGGSDSMRVNLENGAWVCMSCGVKGGDVISYLMESRGLDFVSACKELGAWQEDGRPQRGKPLPFSARAGLEVVAFEALLIATAACNIARGIELATSDRDRLVEAAARIQFIAEEVSR